MKESYILHKFEMYYGRNPRKEALIEDTPVKIGKCPRRQTPTPENLFKFRGLIKIPVN